MKVLDGRRAHQIPKVITIENPEWEKIDEEVFCLRIDEMYIPCVAKSGLDYDYILCGEYKTRKGFDNWYRRMK